MLNSIEVQGRTEEDAIEKALLELGLSRDDVSVEILEQAKSGFLGLKSSPAKIKVTYETAPEGITKIGNFLSGLLLRMDIDAKFEITENDEAVDVNLTGADPGVLIGRRGETLDAIQHLTNYVVNKGSSDRMRINFDTESYRKRRSESLENLAKRTADKALKYRKNMTLDPMNAYERHIVHSALQDRSQISTFSVGSEPNRRVVVAYGNRNNKSERSGSGYRGNSQKSNSPKSENQNSFDSSKKSISIENKPDVPAYREWS